MSLNDFLQTLSNAVGEKNSNTLEKCIILDPSEPSFQQLSKTLFLVCRRLALQVIVFRL